MDRAVDVFLVYFDLGGGSAAWSEQGFAGGFVTCFVPNDDLLQAVEAGKAALVEDGYEVVSVDKVLRYDPDEWDHDEVVRSAVAECCRTKKINYSPFSVWGH